MGKRGRDDDAGSLPIALLLTLVAMSLSAVMLPTALSQVGETRTTVNRSHALHAAQTGLEVGVGALRAAYGADATKGDRSRLPCGLIAGNAGAGSLATYSVEVVYFDDDPSAGTANTLSCADAKSGGTAPRYAELTATGTTTGGQPSRRALRGGYPLKVGVTPAATPTWGPEYDDRVQPRPIVAYSDTRNDNNALCLDPGSGRPTAGTRLRLQSCNEKAQDNGYQQFWYYRENLSIATVGSILADKAMCLDAGPAPAPGIAPTMQPCENPIPVRQRWYYNAFANIELAVSTGPGQDDVALSGLCLNVDRPDTVGSALILGGGSNCRSDTFTARQTFSTYTKVGPGQAGSRTIDCTAVAGYPCVQTQLVNQGMPSRCLDKYSSFMANMECVQDPDLTKVRWNQLWRLPAFVDGPTGSSGPIVAVDPQGRTWCLTTSSADAPTQQECDPLNPSAAQTFTVYRNTGNEFTMYRIRDSRQRCLTHPNGDTHVGNARFWWSDAAYHWKSFMDGCVDSAHDPAAKDKFNRASVLMRQKWNAPFMLPTGEVPETPTPTVAPTAPATTVTALQNVVEIPAP